jgi:transcriptional regulator with XRE-family HTH domain
METVSSSESGFSAEMQDTFRLQREQICRRVAQAREAAGLTQEGLAQSLTACTGVQVTARDVRRYEKSRVPWRLLDDVALLTRTSTEWLLHGKSESGGAARTPSGETLLAGEPAEEHPQEKAWVGARLSRGRVMLGLSLGFLLAANVQYATGSTPVAVFALLVIVSLSWLGRASSRS